MFIFLELSANSLFQALDLSLATCMACIDYLSLGDITKQKARRILE